MERLALDFLHDTQLRAAHFERLPGGGLRLRPQLVRAILAECRASRVNVAADVQWVAQRLAPS